MCYEEIEGMTLFLCRDVYMLYKVGAIEKVVKLNVLWVKRIVNMNVEVTGDDEVMGVMAALRRKVENWLKKVGKGWKCGDGGGGR